MATLTDWQMFPDRVLLSYSDGDEFYVSIDNFHRLFGPIVSGDKDRIKCELSLKV